MMDWKLKFEKWKVIGLIGLIVFLLNDVVAQSSYTFPSTNEKNTSTHRVKVPISNQFINGKDSITYYLSIRDKKPFEGFMVSSSSIKRVARATDTLEVEVLFSPKQNMQHHGVLFVETQEEVLHYVNLSGQGVFSNTYYANTQNKTAEALKTELKKIVSTGAISLGYNAARDAMYGSIDNVGGQVECVYTGTKATFNTRAGANIAGFNCEHTFPQGFFSSNDPMKSDIHHLFPTTQTSNSRRGNDPFGLVSNASWTQGGSKSGGGKFEPRDAHKGTAARAMTYFVIRHQDYSNFYKGQESTMRKWMEDFPPTQKDIDRNNAIYARQKNRNPFVDYPQFLDRISSISGTAIDPTIYHLSWSAWSSKNPLDTPKYTSNTNIVVAALYNSGNHTVKIKNISISNHACTVTALTPTVGPGAICKVQLNCQSLASGNSYLNDSISISTDSPTQAQISLFVHGKFDKSSGVQEMAGSNSFIIVPNPAKNKFRIVGKGLDVNTEISIYTMQGLLVYNKNLSASQTITLDTLSEGTYLVAIRKLNGETTYQKLILQR